MITKERFVRKGNRVGQRSCKSDRNRLIGTLSALIVMWCGSVLVGEAIRLPVVSVTASADDGNVPANTLDGSLATRWSAQGDGQWIRFDLGSSVAVGSVKIAWYKGDLRRYRFEVQT